MTAHLRASLIIPWEQAFALTIRLAERDARFDG
jgi:hypothetical protein